MHLVHPPDEAEFCVANSVADASHAAWPVEVELILSAMEAGQSDRTNRRDTDRASHHTRAALRLFADDPLSPQTALYTRDISPAGMGFITREPLPLGYGGVVTFVQEDGTHMCVACTIFRCREAITGWYEGALHFTA